MTFHLGSLVAPAPGCLCCGGGTFPSASVDHASWAATGSAFFPQLRPPSEAEGRPASLLPSPSLSVILLVHLRTWTCFRHFLSFILLELYRLHIDHRSFGSSTSHPGAELANIRRASYILVIWTGWSIRPDDTGELQTTRSPSSGQFETPVSHQPPLMNQP